MTNMLTVQEVQGKLKMSKNTVYKLVKLKGFPKVCIGKKILIPEDKLEKYIEKHIGCKITID